MQHPALISRMETDSVPSVSTLRNAVGDFNPQLIVARKSLEIRGVLVLCAKNRYRHRNAVETAKLQRSADVRTVNTSVRHSPKVSHLPCFMVTLLLWDLYLKVPQI